MSFPIPRPETTVLYLRSLGPPTWQSGVYRWLQEKQERRVYYIPDNLFAAGDALDHPRFFVGSIVSQFVWDHLYEPWELYGEGKEIIERALTQAEMTLSAYRDFGKEHLTNVFTNAFEKGGLNGHALKRKFQGTPAVICGAGPSLERGIEALKNLSNQGLIFGGGSALGPLSKGGVPLHILAALDPDPPTERFFRQTYFETPLFYQMAVSPTLLSHHHGPKVAFGGSGAFELESYLMEELPSFEVGWNVSTFCVALALLMGCDPIIFVGMDLCVSPEKGYAAGVEGEDQTTNRIEMRDREGNEVWTRPDFLLAKEWLEQVIRLHPQVTFINATPQGLPINGTVEGALEGFGKSCDLSGALFSKIQALPKLSQPQIQEVDQSVGKTGKILEDFLEALKNGKQTVLEAFELEEELFYQRHLRPLWEVWKYPLRVEQVECEKEKKLQELLFYIQVTKEITSARNLPI